ncbi:MAG: manganese catalase family protein, partial [Pontibacter sp.]|nr:manganese catalase family protein [Pontibacter sp.]
ATIQMLLGPINGELKNAAEQSEILQLLDGKAKKEEFIHSAMMNPQFLVLSGGGPTVTNSQGVPWSGTYVNANGDPTVDLRSNMAAESRAKIVYEYLMQFTDDPYVKETLNFLMTREVAHFEMFDAALNTIQPNFPPGVLQGDPRYSNKYFNMSSGADAKGPWNEGKTPNLGETWQYIEEPFSHVVETNGMLEHDGLKGTDRTLGSVHAKDKALSEERSKKVKAAVPEGENQWCEYPHNC